MQYEARKRFGQEFKKRRERLGLTQAEVLDFVSDRLETILEGNWVSKVESGRVVKLNRRTVETLIEALGDDPLRSRALVAAAGLSPIPVTDWDTSLTLGYLAEVAEPYLEQFAALARQALQAEPGERDETLAKGQKLIAQILGNQAA
jgi:transcriptional regulator with XRE-family HTH domain